MKLVNFFCLGIVCLQLFCCRGFTTSKVTTRFSLKNAKDGSDVLATQSKLALRRLGENDVVSSEIDFKFIIENQEFVYHLVEDTTLFKEGAKLHILKNLSVGEVDIPKVYTFINDDAVLTLVNGGKGFDAVVVHNQRAYHITSIDSETIVIEDSSHMDGDCASSETPTLTDDLNGENRLLETTPNIDLHSHSHPRDLRVEKWKSCYPEDSVKRVFSIGIVMGAKLFKNQFKGKRRDALSWIAAQVSEANKIYETQLNIKLEIGDVVIQPTSKDGQDWMNCDGKSVSAQLTGITNWNPPTEQGLWHHFDDCFFSGVIGIAWVNTLCMNGWNTGVSWFSGNTWKTFAHEIGHNFGANHSFAEGQGRTGGLMDYGDGKLDGKFQFNSKYQKKRVCSAVKRVVDSCPHFRPEKSECSGSGTCRKNNKEGTCKNNICKIPEPPREVPKGLTDCTAYVGQGFLGKADLLKGSNGWDFETCAMFCIDNPECQIFTYGSNSGYCETWKGGRSKDNLVPFSDTTLTTYICEGREGTEPKDHKDYCSQFESKRPCKKAKEHKCLWDKRGKTCRADTYVCADYNWNKGLCKKRKCKWDKKAEQDMRCQAK